MNLIDYEPVRYRWTVEVYSDDVLVGEAKVRTSEDDPHEARKRGVKAVGLLGSPNIRTRIKSRERAA